MKTNSFSTYPFNSVVAVVDPYWPWKLRSEPIIDIYDYNAVFLAS